VRVVAAPQPSERAASVCAARVACGSMSSECCECTSLVPGRYATAVTLLNSSARPAKVALHVAPTTFAGATAGRWPDSISFRAEDRIVLEPGTVTTIDCCSVSKLLLGAEAPSDSAAAYGFLLIESSSRLDVTATFTSVGAEGTSPSIDVEQIEGRERRVRERVTPPEAPAHTPAPV